MVKREIVSDLAIVSTENEICENLNYSKLITIFSEAKIILINFT